MNWAEFKDPVSRICLGGTVVTSWSLTHKRWMGGRLEPFYYNGKYFFTEFNEFSENI